MKKPSYGLTRDLWDLAVAVLVFLALVAVFWVYLLFHMLTAAWSLILAHREVRKGDDLSY
jgi:type II secretory pathway component PulC